MPFYVGDTLVKDLFQGDTQVAGVWLGDDKVFPNVLTVTLVANKTAFLSTEDIELTATGAAGTPPYTNYLFEINEGTSWVTLQDGASDTFTGPVGDDGAQYRVTVTDSSPADVTSNVVSVTVQTVVDAGEQQFIANGTFVVPAGVTQVFVDMVGGGAGGGAGAKNSIEGLVGQERRVGAGGSSGASGQAYVGQPIAVTPGETLSVTIGSGGAGGITSSSTVTFFGQAGKSGGASQLKRGTTTLLSCLGGNPGAGGTPTTTSVTSGWAPSASAAGGAGVSASGLYFKGSNAGGASGQRADQINPPKERGAYPETDWGGNPNLSSPSTAFYDSTGDPAVSTSTPSGGAGSSPFGKGGNGATAQAIGIAGSGYGAGGSGGGGRTIGGYSAASNFGGGAGSGGYAKIRWEAAL